MATAAIAIAPERTRRRILGATIRIATAFLITLSAAIILVRAEAQWAHLPVAVDSAIN